MSRRLVAIALGIGLLAVCATLLSGQQASQQQHAKSGPWGGRYQLSDEGVVKVFDTDTGKLYYWFPNGEKEGTGPYVFVMDPVNGVGTRVEVKWAAKPSQ